MDKRTTRLFALLGAAASVIALLGFFFRIFTFDDFVAALWLRPAVESQASAAPRLPPGPTPAATRPVPEPPKTVQLEVIANAPGAEVFHNGAKVGVTPITIATSEGLHSILVVRQPCAAVSDRFLIHEPRLRRLLRFDLDCDEPSWRTDHPGVLRERGACPFEGCTYGDWMVTKRSPLRSSPDAGAEIVAWLEAGDWVQATRGEVVTTEPGHAVLRETYTGRAGGRSFVIPAGEDVYLYTYRGEGAWLGWHRGAPVDVIALTEEEIRSRPMSTWWVFVITSSGTSGWAERTDNFTNSDVFS